MFFDVALDDQAVLECFHFFFFSASRLTEYAMATACFTGLPALISALTFSLNAGLDADFFSGMLFTLFGRFGRLFERFGGGCALVTGLAHLFFAACCDALAFGCDVGV
jgi:hypothetical protein